VFFTNKPAMLSVETILVALHIFLKPQEFFSSFGHSYAYHIVLAPLRSRRSLADYCF
jgi:hypothetical protein